MPVKAPGLAPTDPLDVARLFEVDAEATARAAADAALQAQTTPFVASLRDGGGAITQAMLDAIASGADRILVGSHHAGIDYGRATYTVGAAHGTPDGYVTINAGGQGLTLEVVDGELKSGCWGIKADGSSEQTAAQAWADYAASIASSTIPVTLIVEGGELGVVNLSIGAHCRVHMYKKARFKGLVNDGAFNSSLPCVQIGSETTKTSNVGELTKGLGFYADYHVGLAAKGAIGVRIVNSVLNTIGLRTLSGCESLIQFTGAGEDNNFAHNLIVGGSLYYGRYLSSFFGKLSGGVTSNAGWVNENTWLKPRFHASSSMNEEGSVFAIRFFSEDGAYNGQNNNTIIAPSIEVGGAHDYPGAVAFAAGERFNVDGREYECDIALTLPGTAPTHTAGTVGDITYIGDFYRSPVLYDSAGGSNTISNARWEGGYGPFAVVKLDRPNPHATCGGHTAVSLSYTGGVVDRPGSVEDMELMPRAQLTALESEISRTSRQKRNAPAVNLKNIDKSLIYSEETSGWHSHRFPMMSYENVRSVGAGSIQPERLHLMHDGVYSSSVYNAFSIPLAISEARTFVVKNNNYRTELDQRCRIFALDSGGTVVDQTDPADTDMALGPNSYVNLKGLAHPGATRGPFLVHAKDGVSTMHITLAGQPVRDVTIEVAPTIAELKNVDIQYTSFDDRVYESNTQRASNGEPDYGWFEDVGEIIVSVKAADTRRWIVEEPGVQGPPWTTATTVYSGELRSNGVNTYFAVTGGISATTGATAPTHTSGTVSDGTVSWTWFRATPTISEYTFPVPVQSTFTPAVTFATVGDFSPTYDNQQGVYWKTGKRVDIQLALQFDANAYTAAASGNFQITGLPFAASSSYPYLLAVTRVAQIDLASGNDITTAVVSGTTLEILESRDASTATEFLTTVAVPASQANVQIDVAGWYLTD